MKRIIILAFSIVMMVACHNDSAALDEMEEIKSWGNNEPFKALQHLDSLDSRLKNASEYAAKKYELLRIRLSDKSDIIPASDSAIVALIPYFESHGTTQDIQEVYYYAGSVYRDLCDYPRALDYFLNSCAMCEDMVCDSVMLRNIYSNLFYIFFVVQDFDNALVYARKEFDLSDKLGILNEIQYQHLGTLMADFDSMSVASQYINAAYNLERSRCKDISMSHMMTFMMDFLRLKDYKKAAECYEYINIHYDRELLLADETFLFDAGRYFQVINNFDSARYYFHKALDDKRGLELWYDASKSLTMIDISTKDVDALLKDANEFVHACDSINFGGRQRLAATVNNQFKYYRNKAEDERIKTENVRKSKTISILSLSIVCIILLFSLMYYYLRQRQMKVLFRKMEEHEALRCIIERKETEISLSRKELTMKEKERKELEERLSWYDTELKEMKEKLKEKMIQNASLLGMLHQTELEDTASHVIEKIRKSSVGQHKMSPEDWKELYSAVDDIHPEFKESIVQKIGAVNDRILQICYLMRIGLSNPQIVNLTDMSAATVWRNATKYSKILDILNSATL